METLAAHEKLDKDEIFSIYGYKIFRHPNSDSFFPLKNEFRSILKNNLESFSGNKINDFPIENYHKVIAEQDIDHHEFLKRSGRDLNEEMFRGDYLQGLKEVAEQYFCAPLVFFNNKIEFRVVRPKFEDNNPMHRDHWFGYFRPLINIYVPLAGSWCDSAMKIVPKSHLWSDESIKPAFEAGKGKTIKNGIAYSVPEIVHSDHEINPHRPDILETDFMLFSPILVHGAGTNHSEQTRFSLEIRLEFAEQ